MAQLFTSFIALLVTLPILGYLIAFLIIKGMTKNHRKAVNIAIDSSTILFISAVHYLFLVIWDQSFLPYILLTIICIAIIFVFVHWGVKREIVLFHVFRGFWRFNFFIFSLAYTILFIYGLINRVTLLLSFVP